MHRPAYVFRTIADGLVQSTHQAISNHHGYTVVTTVSNIHRYYGDVIMRTMVSQVTSVWMVCSTVCSGAHQRKHRSSASLAFVRGIHRWPVNSPHKRQVKRKMFPLDDVIVNLESLQSIVSCVVIVISLSYSDNAPSGLSRPPVQLALWQRLCQVPYITKM